MRSFTYSLLYIWALIHALLPLRVLYVLSDLFYLIIYKVIGYRLRVVRSNLKNSFPEKTSEELKQLERDFYHHFCDYIVETIKLLHISKSEIQRRAHITNPELVSDLIAKGHTTFIIYFGHYGNWEWFSSAPLWLEGVSMYQIYRPLKSKAFDKLFIQLRSKFGSFCLPKNNVVREMVGLKKRQEHALVGFMADQTPSRANIHYWSRFLNQETPIYSGPERIAHKLNFPVLYMDVQRIKRGYYESAFRLVCEHPQQSPEFELTETYTRMMEETILRNPAYWLWTHKRWKHKKEQADV